MKAKLEEAGGATDDAEETAPEEVSIEQGDDAEADLLGGLTVVHNSVNVSPSTS